MPFATLVMYVINNKSENVKNYRTVIKDHFQTEQEASRDKWGRLGESDTAPY